MGLLRWLFPGPAEKVAKARRLMAEGRFAEARLLVVDVDDEAARALVAEAEAALVRVNLEGALQRCRAGDEAAVAGLLVGARRFARGRGRRRSPRWRRRWGRCGGGGRSMGCGRGCGRRRIGGGGWGMIRVTSCWGRCRGRGRCGCSSGEEPFGLPGIELAAGGDFVPGWVPGAAEPGQPTASERAAVADALRGAWPEALHGAVAAAGDALVEAMVALGAGRPERAVARLIDLPAENAAARFELGRAAAALGQHEAAAVALGEARAAAGAAFVVGAVVAGARGAGAAVGGGGGGVGGGGDVGGGAGGGGASVRGAGDGDGAAR
ncbi:MAG: hypothetical protein R3F65_01680 [bacterium]